MNGVTSVKVDKTEIEQKLEEIFAESNKNGTFFIEQELEDFRILEVRYICGATLEQRSKCKRSLPGGDITIGCAYFVGGVCCNIVE